MTWTAPDVTRPGGSTAAPEPELLHGLLDWHRATLLHKCAGLTGEQLAATPIAESNLSLLGLIRHLSKVERIWFRERFAQQAVPRLYSTPQRPDADYEDVDRDQAEAAYAVLLAEQQAARTIAAGVSLDDSVPDADGDAISLRFIHIHMIGEYARHNGHADFLRQCVDGVTGA
jgi:uncharacterized damage-inducible protein DinB